jgi:hypothetical protein
MMTVSESKAFIQDITTNGTYTKIVHIDDGTMTCLDVTLSGYVGVVKTSFFELRTVPCGSRERAMELIELALQKMPKPQSEVGIQPLLSK